MGRKHSKNVVALVGGLGAEPKKMTLQKLQGTYSMIEKFTWTLVVFLGLRVGASPRIKWTGHLRGGRLSRAAAPSILEASQKG